MSNCYDELKLAWSENKSAILNWLIEGFKTQKVLRQHKYLVHWLRERDLNPRPLGYGPNELPDCSTPPDVARHPT